MSSLFLLRHARAAWPEPGTRDYDRALTASGVEEASAIGHAMRERGYLPDHVVCSPARRAIETWQAVAASLGRKPSDAFLSETLYAGDAASYLTIIRNAGTAKSILVVGHNPMIEDVAAALSSVGDPQARGMLANGFPTAGLARLAVAGDLASLSAETARLDQFLIPSAL